MPPKTDAGPVDKIELLIADAVERSYLAYLYVPGSYSHSALRAMLALKREFEIILGRPLAVRSREEVQDIEQRIRA
jgi:hypothetical protein